MVVLIPSLTWRTWLLFDQADGLEAQVLIEDYGKVMDKSDMVHGIHVTKPIQDKFSQIKFIVRLEKWNLMDNIYWVLDKCQELFSAFYMDYLI